MMIRADKRFIVKKVIERRYSFYIRVTKPLNMKIFTRMTAIAALALSLTGCVDTTEEAPAPVISTVKISNITLTEYPLTNGAVAWDDPIIGSATGADIRWKITGPENFESTVYFENCDGSTLVFNTGGLPIYLNHPLQEYTFEIWDKDALDGSDIGSVDDLMSSITFLPWIAGAVGTETLELSNPQMTVQIEFTYMFQ